MLCECCIYFAFDGVTDKDEKLAKGSVAHLDITIQVDFESKNLQYYQLQFGKYLDMTVFVNVVNNRTEINLLNRQKNASRVRYIDIVDLKIDMTITIYLDNFVLT